jgi:hypothetical protein
MAQLLTVTAQALLDQVSKEPQIVLDIEGVELLFAAKPLLKVLTWDDDSPEALWDNELFWDGSIADSKAVDYISLGGTTTNITQQIQPDKSSTSSISTVTISIVDKNARVSNALSFNAITEILGKKATFSIGFAQGNYPDDFQNVFIGVISDYYTDSGTVNITLSSSEASKRQVFLPKYQSELSANIDAVTTTIPVLTTAGLIPSGDALTSYIRINDEIMQVVSFTDTSIEVLRDQLNSTNEIHEAKDTVESFYRLQGKPLDLARKIMLSNEGNTFFISDDVPKSINFISVIESIPNAIIFDNFNIENKTGLTIGDKVKLDSAANSGTYTIIGFGQLDNGDSYIITDGLLTLESEYTGTFEYNSQWNTLPVGLEMISNQVDLAQFADITSRFGSNFEDQDYYIKDTIDNSKDFIDRDIFFSNGLYSIIRAARVSVKYVAPPFSDTIIAPINTNNVLNVERIRQRRSLHKYFYNSFIWQYNEDSVDDRYLNGKVVISNNSRSRINTGFKQLKIEAKGLRATPSADTFITNLTQRFVDRYQFAPVYVDNVEVDYRTGYNIEVGDIVPFGGADMQFINFKTGERGSNPELYEVINKSLNVKNGRIKLSLLNTNYEINARYGVFSLASNITSFPSTTSIKIAKTLDTGEYINESDKWLDFIGSNIRIRSTDYVEDYTTVLLDVSSSNNKVLEFQDPITHDNTKRYVVEIPLYNDTDDAIDAEYKLQFSHMVAQVKITGVTDDKTFDVDEPGKLFVGSRVYVHSKNYQDDSFDADDIVIESIVGNTVTLSDDLAFTPQVDYLVDASDFQDGGFAYRLI